MEGQGFRIHWKQQGSLRLKLERYRDRQGVSLKNQFQQELFLRFWSRPRLGLLKGDIAVGVLKSGPNQLAQGARGPRS